LRAAKPKLIVVCRAEVALLAANWIVGHWSIY
jgi:DMSO/TMAO reductase YedYZ heme-binding membrane subunit